MDVVQQLREKNPGLRIYSVLDPEFSEYGVVLKGKGLPALSLAMAETPIPDAGNIYAMSDGNLEQTEAFHWIRREVFGAMDAQAGYCNGRGYTLNALEFHKCSEVNYSTTGCVLLMALQEKIRGGILNSADVVGFYLPPEVLVEVLPGVLHFAPCRISRDGFNCLVVLERNVNEETVQTQNPDGEKTMLWRRGKWMICHPDSPQAANGAYVGIQGVNIQLCI